MRKLLIYTISLLVVTGLSGCEQQIIDSPQTDEHGTLNLNLSNDDQFVLVKSSSPTFTLSIYNQTDGSFVKNYTDVAIGQQKPINISAGTYKVTAASTKGNPAAAFGVPYFYGEVANIDVVNGQSTELQTINCTMANFKVGVKLSSDFVTNFKTCKVTVTTSLGSLVYLYTKDNAEGSNMTVHADGYIFSEDGYFKVPEYGSFTWTIYLENNDYNGTNSDETYTVTETRTGVTAAQYYLLDFTLQPAEQNIGGAYMKLLCNGEMTEGSEINVTPDFSFGSVFPTISASSNGAAWDLFYPLETIGGQATDVVLSITSATELTALTLNQADILAGVEGVSINDITDEDGKTVKNLDITAYINTNCTAAGNHDLTIYAANANGSIEQPFTIKVIQ